MGTNETPLRNGGVYLSFFSFRSDGQEEEVDRYFLFTINNPYPLSLPPYQMEVSGRASSVVLPPTISLLTVLRSPLILTVGGEVGRCDRGPSGWSVRPGEVDTYSVGT